MNQIVDVNRSGITAETVALAKAALGSPFGDRDLSKAWSESASATSGLTYYNLEPAAKRLYPVITPLRNRLARVGITNPGIQANWRAITGINVNSIEVGVSQGNRGAVQATSTANYQASYAGLGLEDFVTFEADYAADGFIDLKAEAQLGLLRALMIGEEKVILGGQSSYGIGQANQPTASDNTAAGGTIPANTTVSIYVVPLNLFGLSTGTVTGGIRGLVTRSNADYSTDQYGGGSGKISANRQITTANDGNNAHTLSVSTAALTGAVGYAWFWGAVGAEVLGAITTINSLVISTAAGTGTQTAASLGTNDNSANSLVFDGLFAQLFKAGSNSYIATQATGTAGTGTPLTADGDGNIVEIDTALQSFWDNYRLSPDTIWVASQEQKNIRKKVVGGTNIGAQRFVFTTEQDKIVGGSLVATYLNPFAMEGAKPIEVRLHPNMPAGTILFDTDELPYPLSNVPKVKRILTRRDYYSMAWPLRARKWEYGVYSDEVLQHYFPPAMGVITNIANG